MNTENKYPANNDQHWEKEKEIGDTPGIGQEADVNSLETEGPDKDQEFNVLNEDGSLGDLPDNDANGKGALDGTVGLGT